jgi:hypothetical protein
MQYEVRAMSFGEILDTGFRLLTNHFGLLIGIAGMVYVPLAVLGAVVVRDLDGISLAVLGFAWLVTVVLSPVVTGAMTFALGEVFLGREVSIGRALRAGLSMVTGLIGTGLLSTLAILLGLIVFVVPGVYLIFAYLLLTPVMVFERTFGPRALGRSMQLMRGSMGRAFGILVVTGIMTSVIGWTVNLSLGAVPLLAPVGSALVQTLVSAYSAAVVVLLYFDIRSRKEAFDVEHLAQAVEADMRRAPIPSPAT